MTTVAAEPPSTVPTFAPEEPSRPSIPVMPAPTRPSGDQRLLLHDVPWGTYVAIGELFRDRPVYMTYDRGELEIMTKGLRHELFGEHLFLLIHAWSQVARVPLKSGGSTTFQRDNLEKGLEPDKCFWIENEAKMRTVRDWNPAQHPPPDLAVEVDITSSSLDRMGIYAALGVPEVWRYDGERLTFHRLGPAGGYETVPQSRWFPQLPAAELVRFLGLVGTTDETTWLEQFRDWARQTLAAKAG
jgi:Uma2 family endonuclease